MTVKNHKELCKQPFFKSIQIQSLKTLKMHLQMILNWNVITDKKNLIYNMLTLIRYMDQI